MKRMYSSYIYGKDDRKFIENKKKIFMDLDVAYYWVDRGHWGIMGYIREVWIV